MGATGSASFLLHPARRAHCPKDFTKCLTTSGGSCHKMGSWMGWEEGNSSFLTCD